MIILFLNLEILGIIDDFVNNNILFLINITTGNKIGFLIQLVFCKKWKTMWFIGVEVAQETSAHPPKKNPGSAPGYAIKTASVDNPDIRETKETL